MDYYKYYADYKSFNKKKIQQAMKIKISILSLSLTIFLPTITIINIIVGKKDSFKTYLGGGC